VPAVQERVDLSAGALGVAFAGLMVGAFAGLPLAGALVARLGSRSLLAGSLAVFLVALAAIPLSPGLAVLTAVLAVFGATNSGVDVAMNVQGAHVERAYARPILSSFHAMFSVGALGAAGVAALLAAADVSVAWHFALAAAVLAAAGLGAVRVTTPEERDPDRTPAIALPTRALAIPGAIAFFMVVAEDVANTWSAVYVRTGAEAGAGVAAAGFSVYQVGMLAGRAVADRVVAARGPAFVVAAGGVVSAAGMTLALLLPEPGVVVAALFLVGVGLAPAFPVVYSVVAQRDPAVAGTAIAAVTTIGYLGSVVGPPAVGALAAPFGLRAALVVVPLALVAMTLLARRLRA
jgi:MFS family permease